MNTLARPEQDALAVAAQAANIAHAGHVLADYRSRQATNTLAAQDGDLAHFAAYLREVAGATMDAAQLTTDAAAWAQITHGLVAGYVQWQLRGGYALATINRRLASVKAYAQLAAQAGALDGEAARLITGVAGYGRKDGRKVDEKRRAADVAVRRGHKKAAPVRFTAAQARALKQQPDTPQGRRDALMLCLLLDHGLRDSELVLLDISAFDLAAGTMRFWRPKVDLEQTHRLTRDTLHALKAWVESGDCPASGPVLRSSRKGGALGPAGMSLSGVAQRVRALGEAVAAVGLSPHDCRHYWATRWAGKVSAMRLQEAGGWASMATVRRYVERASIANEGMDDGE